MDEAYLVVGFKGHHVNTIEDFWSLLRSWLRPYRDISEEKLPFYLGFFERKNRRGFLAMTNRVVEFVHNVRFRGKTLFPSFLECLLASVPEIHKEPQFFSDFIQNREKTPVVTAKTKIEGIRGNQTLCQNRI